MVTSAVLTVIMIFIRVIKLPGPQKRHSEDLATLTDHVAATAD